MPQRSTTAGATSSAATWLGYESRLLARLSDARRGQLDALTHAWGVSCVLLAVPPAVAAWEVEHSAVLAVALALGTALLVWNLLRLLVAGGGAALDRPWSPTYRPPRAPGIMIGGLAFILAQPAQLLLPSPQADAEVAAHRAALLSAHAEALQTVRGVHADGVTHGEGGAEDVFAAEIASCEFVVLRMGALWKHPQRAVVFTTLYALMVLVPFLLARTVWQPAVVDYERARHRWARREMLRRRQAARVSVETALAAHPSFARRDHHHGPGVDL